MANEKKMLRMNELTDDQLEQAAGGTEDFLGYCDFCRQTAMHFYWAGGIKCYSCGTNTNTGKEYCDACGMYTNFKWNEGIKYCSVCRRAAALVQRSK